MKFKNFIFDVDGTLWDASRPASEGFTLGLKRDGRYPIEITVKDIKENFGRTMHEIGADWFPKETPEVQVELIKKCVAGQYECMEKCDYDILYPGVAETLEELSKTCGLYIISNCLDGYIDILYQKYGNKRLFKDQACLNKPGGSKAENIRLMVEKYNLTDVCYVGDIQGDFNASAAAGVHFIYASYGYGSVPEAKYVINEFKDLLKFA